MDPISDFSFKFVCLIFAISGKEFKKSLKRIARRVNLLLLKEKSVKKVSFKREREAKRI